MVACFECDDDVTSNDGSIWRRREKVRLPGTGSHAVTDSDPNFNTDAQPLTDAQSFTNAQPLTNAQSFANTQSLANAQPLTNAYSRLQNQRTSDD